MTGMGQMHERGRWQAGAGFASHMAVAIALAFTLLATAACADKKTDPNRSDCVAVGTWLNPATATSVAADRALASMARRPVVLLGEAHDNAEHHRWQLHTLAALYGQKSNMILGFESFPRRVQPVLDRWVNGELDTESFLEAVDWRKVWGFDAGLYLPLFHFARQNRVPMIALNVDRALVSRVSHQGWAAIPADERAGLSDPAPAAAAYRESLARIYLYKQSLQAGGDPGTAVEEADIASVVASEDFMRFVEAQLTWDRAMAEALAAAHQRQPAALVVGIMGRGHIEYRHGVPHQLADLGISEAAILLPVEVAQACEELPADLADAVFVVEPASRIKTVSAKARLGVLIETAKDGVRIVNIMKGSVAEATALVVGDIMVSAAGRPVGQVSDLIEIVQRQAPGTWLPIVIRRDGAEIELVAKFPTVFETPE